MAKTLLYRRIIPTPVGEMVALALASANGGANGDAGVVLCEFLDDSHLNRSTGSLARFFPGAQTEEEREDPILTQLATEIGEYFAGLRREFDVPLRPVGTPFQMEVWEALRQIPYGTTRSYAEQARMIGKPQAVRAVAQANGRNRMPILIPCHRVIGSDGSLTGYSAGIERKIALLELERRYLL